MAKQASHKWGTAGFIFSLISLLLCWFPFIGFFLALTAIIFAIIQVTKDSCALEVFTIVFAIIAMFINSFFIFIALTFGVTLLGISLLLAPFT